MFAKYNKNKIKVEMNVPYLPKVSDQNLGNLRCGAIKHKKQIFQV